MSESIIKTVTAKGIKLPEYAHIGDAGADLVTNNILDVYIGPRATYRIPTGVKVAIPEGYFGWIVSRSSAWKRGLLMSGIIDSSYTGEIFLNVANNSDSIQIVESKSRIAQLLILPVVRAKFEPVETLDETERGESGFGSTGT